MYRDINIQFNNVKKLHDSKMYEESLNFYEQISKAKPEIFTKNNLISYCCANYQEMFYNNLR